MQESKFFLSTSRYESFGLAAAEATACGCAFVGPLVIPILNNEPTPQNNSFLDSTFSLLAGKLQDAAKLEEPSSNQMKIVPISSPQSITNLLLRLSVVSK
jgi:hypothetical protein